MAATGIRLPGRLLTRKTIIVLLTLAMIVVLINVRLDMVGPVALKSVLRLAGGGCRLDITYPDTVPVGAPFPVKIEITDGSIRSIPRAEASVVVGDSPGRTVTLYYGIGTTNLTLTREGAWDVLVSVSGRLAYSAGGRVADESCTEQFSVKAVNLDDPTVETKRIQRGTLNNAALQWTKGFVVIEGAVTVPASSQLIVNPGVVVLMKPDARIEVLGEAKLGTKEGQPIVFTSYPSGSSEVKPWNQLLFGRYAIGILHNAWFLQGGASAHSNFGNLDTQRVIHGEESSDIAFIGGGIIDNVGGAIGGERCRLQVHRAVISRCNGGGSVQQAVVTLQNVHVTEIGQYQTSSSSHLTGDGFTFYSSRITPPDSEFSKISNSVFAVGGGLGIHHKGTNLVIESTIVEDFRRSCVVTSGEKSRVTIRSAIMRNCRVGLQQSYGQPSVTLSNSAVVNNEVGIWYGDENVENGGKIELENTLAMGNAEKNLKVYSNGVERADADRGSENVRLKCFFVNSESVKRKARSQFTLVEKKYSPCLQPKISLNHSDCNIALSLPHGKCLWSEYNPETLSGVRLERLDLCQECCKETSELTFGNFDHWRMLNIQNRKGATIHTGQEVETREECGVSFAADLYQYTDSDCQKTKVQLKSVFSNILHFQGESHLRELKAHYFDRVMKTSLTPPSFGMILDFSNIMDKNASALAREDVDCTLSDRNENGVSAFVTAWLPDIGMYTRLSVLLADLVHPKNFFTYVPFLYLANCMKSGHSHFADKETNNYVLIDNDRCLVPERVASGDMPPAYRYRLDRLSDILFTKSHVCKVPEEMIERLKLATSVSSKVPSLGIQFKDEVLADKVMAPLLLKEDPEIYEEVDGRASTLLAEYNSLCENNDVDKFDNKLRDVYKTSAIKHTYIVEGRDYILANFADDDLAYLKVVSDGPRKQVGDQLFNGGLAELVSYHVDRLVGLGRVPVAASRRLLLDGSVVLKGVINAQGEVVQDLEKDHTTLGRYLSDVQTKNIRANGSVEWIASQLRHDPAEKHPILDVVVVGKIKDLKQDIKLSNQVKNFLNHDAWFSDLKRLGITRQMTWDIMDMHLLDFLLHNPHRTTFATSELRLVSYDNTRAFSADIGGKVCEPLLRCPPVFYSSVEGGEKSGCPASCPTNTEDGDKNQNCRFRRGTFERIRRGSEAAAEKDNLVNKLRNALSSEAINVNSHKDYFGRYDLYEGFQNRIAHLSSHVKRCMEKYGEYVFV
ncbi:Hypp5199 [Branchiostoma lanceolatum]|uniref:Hypp5199 protein n=1 Tax=Branchiostoma lanceolatum TaxID=7740 RepID=A0A8K0F3N6_BRALA|nr:Hypp5199 [Branchiostoma lanceolatum]